MTAYPRESKEFVSIIFTVNGVAVTADDAAHIGYCLIMDPARPSDWVDVETLDTEIGFLIGPGSNNDFSNETTYPVKRSVWVKDTDNPEIPVRKCSNYVEIT